MNCERVDELLPAYALDAVDAEERDAIEAHLAGCNRHPELAELRAVGLALAELAPEHEPSPDLEQRLLAAADDTHTPSHASARRRARRSLAWPALAAALAVAVVALAGWNLVLRGNDSTPELVYVYRDGDAWMRVEGESGGSAVTVTLGGLNRRPDAEAFQVWAIRDGTWLTIGVCNTNSDGWWLGDFTFSLERDDAVALTVEPARGSPRPTGARVFAPPP